MWLFALALMGLTCEIIHFFSENIARLPIPSLCEKGSKSANQCPIDRKIGSLSKRLDRNPLQNVHRIKIATCFKDSIFSAKLHSIFDLQTN